MIHKLYLYSEFVHMHPGCTIMNLSLKLFWNHYFSRSNVDVVGARVLDKFNGANHYSKTMKAFAEALFVPQEFIWVGALGGKEGLN